MLAAVQEILLKSRTQFVTGTEAEWTAANPVLLDGEYGLVKGTSPVKFKVGDGTKNWTNLGWGNATALWQLAADSEHRLVTDAEKMKWNKKGEVFFFDYAAYASGDTTKVNVQKAVVKAILNAVKANENVAIFVRDVTVPGIGDGNTVVSGSITITNVTSTMVVGTVNGFGWESEDSGKTALLVTSKISFKSDSTVAVEGVRRSMNVVTEDGLPVIDIVKGATESGFASTYYLTVDGRKTGVAINIPLDQVLRSSSIKTVTTANTPYTGAKVNDKYIEFLFQNNNTAQYLPVQDLVDVYKGDDTYIEVSSTNVITLKYDALKNRLKTDFDAVYDAKGAGTTAAQKAIDEFKASTFVIKCTIPGMN